MTNKLSNAQAKVLEHAKKDIDAARSMNFYDWMRTSFRGCTNDEIDNMGYVEWYREYYEQNKNGIAHTHCNGKTIEKLQKLGLIEIIYNGTNKTQSFDTIKVLNY